MRLRTMVSLLGGQSYAVRDEHLLNVDAVVALGGSSEHLGESAVYLARFGSELTWQERQAGEGVLMVHVPLSVGDSLDDIRMPPAGVIFVASDRPFEEFLDTFRHLPEACAVLSLKRNQLHAAFLHSYDVQQFVDRSFEVLGNPIIVTNSDHRLLASAGDVSACRADVREVIEKGYVSDTVNSELEADGVIRDVRLRKHAVLSTNPRFGQRWVHSIVYSHHMELGRFDVLEDARPITPIDLELIDYAGSLAGVMIERLGMAGGRVGSGSSVLRDLITKSFVNDKTMRAQVSLTSLPLDETYVMLAVVGQRGAGSEYYTRAGRRVANVVRSCLWTVQGNVLAVLMPIGKEAGAGYGGYGRAHRVVMGNRKLRAVLANNDMNAFVSEPFDDLAMSAGRFGQCIELMDACLATASRDDPEHRVSFFWERRFMVLAHSAKTFDQMEVMLDKRVVAMRLYDREHGTQYFDTALMSVRHPGSPADAAQALNVHRNTYFYRANKVRELFNLDLKDGDDRLSLAFTARIMEGLGERFHFDSSDYE